MLTRICLIVAILAGLAVGVLNFVMVKEKITTLQKTLKDTEDKLATSENNLTKAKGDLTKAQRDLDTAKRQRDDAVAQRVKAETEAQAADKRAQKATSDLADATKKLDVAQGNLAAYTIIGLTPEQVMGAAKQIKELQDLLAGQRAENVVLGKKIKNLETELAIYRDPGSHPALPAGLKGLVVVSDPKWDFVVLNVGEDQGVLMNGELLVHRNGKLVAKVVVRLVEKNRCIANVVSDWKNDGVILEGDSVFPATPAS